MRSVSPRRRRRRWERGRRRRRRWERGRRRRKRRGRRRVQNIQVATQT
uniref:Uncharacterized protein n=1 Tax=Arundo donax TaxID=35708 RepID=A0A0A9GVP1_ARUDO